MNHVAAEAQGSGTSSTTNAWRRRGWLPRSGVPVSVLLWLGLVSATIVAIATNIGETRRVLNVVENARADLLLVAIGLEVLFVANMTLFYTSTFHATRIRAPFGRFLLLTSAAYLVNLVSKTGGLGGVALYLQEARKDRTSAAEAGAAYLVVYVLGYAAYTAILVLGLLLLYLSGKLTAAEEVASAVMIALIVAVGAGIGVSLRSRITLERFYLSLIAPMNGVSRLLRRKDAIEQDTARATASAFYDVAERVRRRPRKYALPLSHALGVELLAAAMLYLIARSVQADISPAQAVSAYAISLLFSMVAITPSGIGFVEVSLSALLISFGVPKQNAIAAALAYRLFEFWLPVLLGILGFAALRATHREAISDESP